jgi:hypothetical protein
MKELKNIEKIVEELINDWNKEIESIKIDGYSRIVENISYFPMSNKDICYKVNFNFGETKFNNKKVDYMTDQHYRFIVQFYPLGFLPELRNKKLEKIGI